MSDTPKYDLYSPEFRQNAHAVYAQMRAEDPVLQQVGLNGETKIWFVTRYADVEKVLLDDARFVRDPALVSPELGKQFGVPDQGMEAMMFSHMLNRDADAHRRLRSLVSKAFTPKVIHAMRPRIEVIANNLLDKVVSRGSMELISEYAFPLPITVIAELLGIPIGTQNEFRAWSLAFVRPAVNEEEEKDNRRLLIEFATYMQQLVAERRKLPGEDLISGLIHAEDQGDRLSENELYSMLGLLIVAGHETTVSLIGNAVLAILQYPHVDVELRNDLSRIPQALEEFLRFDSPVERTLTRFVAHDTELAGQQLKKGDLLIAVNGSANRDEEHFDQPATLDIHRQFNPHMAFGKGAHYCLGAPLARLEGEIALRVLLQRFPDLSMDIAESDLRWRALPLFRSLERLPVSWTMR